MMKRMRVLLLLCAALIVVWCPIANGQATYGQITGTVTDASGAAMPGVRVTITNLGTNETHSMNTDSFGVYRFPNLLPGSYRIVAVKAGFKRFMRGPIALEVQNTLSIGITMQIGAVTQTVRVTAQTPLLQPATSSLGQVVGSRPLNELPLNGRNPLALTALVPGVVPQGGAESNLAGQNPFAAGNIQIGGGAANQSAEFWDGAPLNNANANILVMVPTQDSLQEFKVQTNVLPAEYGRFAGGVINMATRTGTNQLHGTAYEYFRNRVLNANTFFNNEAGISRPPYVQNQFGASLGGPVVIPGVIHGKNKLFFFTNIERYTQRNAVSSVLTVPTAAEINGDFSSARNANGSLIPIYDPLTTTQVPGEPGTYTRQQFPGNIIPNDRIDTAAKYLADYHAWGPPNVPGTQYTDLNNWVGNSSSGAYSLMSTNDIEANISSKQSIFARYTYYHQNLLGVDPFKTGAYPYQTYAVPQAWKNQQFVISDNYVFSPTTMLNVRFAVLRAFTNQAPGSVGFNLRNLGWPQSLISSIAVPTLPTLNVSGMTTFYQETGTVIHIEDSNFDLAPSLVKIFGRQSLNFGGEYRPDLLNYLQQNAGGGDFNFTSAFTGSNPISPVGGFGFASFLLGYPASGSLDIANTSAQKLTYDALYAEDNIRMTKKLTFNLGLRYELNGSFTERYNRETVFLPNAPDALAQPTGLALKGVVGLVDSSQRPSRSNLNLDTLQFAPRIGLAYRLRTNTVVRTGYGISYFPPQDGLSSVGAEESDSSYVNPMVTTINGGITPFNKLSNPFPSGVNGAPGRNLSIVDSFNGTGVSTELPTMPFPYAQQWNFDVQQQLPGNWLIDLAYAGAKGIHLPIESYNINTLPPNKMGPATLTSVPNPFFGLLPSTSSLSKPTITAGQLELPYPQYNAINLAAYANGDSHYESMQLKVQKNLRSGGEVLVAYTVSKLISDVDSLDAWLESTAGGG